MRVWLVRHGDVIYLCICGSYNDAVTVSDYTLSDGRTISGKWMEWMWNEAAVAYLIRGNYNLF
jgi:hypothetical protein